MREITFDIETANVLPAFARNDLSRLELAIVGVHDSKTGDYTSYTKEELPLLWPLLENSDVLIGYNSDAFDIPLLNNYYPGDLTRMRSIDLMVEVQNVLGRRLRLQSIAEATLGRGKSGHGLESVEWWQQGLVDKVRQYCLDDVRITREIYDYARAKGHIKYKDLRDIREVKLDTKHWDDGPTNTAFTHTLSL